MAADYLDLAAALRRTCRDNKTPGKAVRVLQSYRILPAFGR